MTGQSLAAERRGTPRLREALVWGRPYAWALPLRANPLNLIRNYRTSKLATEFNTVTGGKAPFLESKVKAKTR